ncbi:MAG: hypothetical protein WCD44_03615 [Candidatus Babeliales bacterium]
MYTRKQFGRELKTQIEKKHPVSKIGEWAHTVYLQHIEDIDLDFRDILLTLNTMELGPEFAFSYEELEQIAGDLIVGKNVKLQ